MASYLLAAVALGCGVAKIVGASDSRGGCNCSRTRGRRAFTGSRGLGAALGGYSPGHRRPRIQLREQLAVRTPRQSAAGAARSVLHTVSAISVSMIAVALVSLPLHGSGDAAGQRSRSALVDSTGSDSFRDAFSALSRFAAGLASAAQIGSCNTRGAGWRPWRRRWQFSLRLRFGREDGAGELPWRRFARRVFWRYGLRGHAVLPGLLPGRYGSLACSPITGAGRDLKACTSTSRPRPTSPQIAMGLPDACLVSDATTALGNVG